MANIYERLGVRTIINAKGPSTRLSGGIMRPRWPRRWSKPRSIASRWPNCRRAPREIIAEATGAEAGLVTSGAAAGLLLGTAACVTGLDAGRMNRLPDTSDMANEIVIVRSQRNFYDHLIRAVGIRLVEVGLPDRYAGAGARDAEPWEIADALSRAHRRRALGGRPERPAAARAGGGGRPCRRRAGSGRRRGAAAAGGQSAPVHRGRRRSGRLLRRQGDRRAAGLRHPVRPALSRHGRRAAEPRSRRVLRAVGAACAFHRQDAAQGPAAARHRPGLQGRQGGDRRPAHGAAPVRRGGSTPRGAPAGAV